MGIAIAGVIMQAALGMSKTSDPNPDKLVDLRVAHLNMIQGVISRMSGFSAGVKNFCVTISAAIIAIAFQKQIPVLVWSAVAVVLIFFIMDTYYLSLEKRYRELYENVAVRPFSDAKLSLKLEPLKLSTCFYAARSLSVAGFYFPLLIGVVSLLCIANHDQSNSSQGTPISDSGVIGAAERLVTTRVTSREGTDGRKGKEEPGSPSERIQPSLDANTNTIVAGEPVRTR